MSINVHPTPDSSNYTADVHFPADASQDFDAWHYDAPGPNPLEIAAVRIVNHDGTREDTVHLGQKLVTQWSTPIPDLAFVALKAGLAGAPLPTERVQDAEYSETQNSVTSRYGTRVEINAARCHEESVAHREVEIAFFTPSRDSRETCESVTVTVDQARVVAEGILLAIAAHDVDVQARGDDQ